MKPPTCSRCQTVYSLGFTESGGGPRGQREHGKHPMLLHCGHTVCRPCLRKCETSENVLQCPRCQKLTTQGPRGLDPDLYTVGMIWMRRLQLEHESEKIRGNDPSKARKKPAAGTDAGKAGPQCVECQKPAHCQCLKCESVLCRPCFHLVHSASLSLKKHRPMPLPNSGSLGERVMGQRRRRSERCCSTHEQCMIEYFCNQDKVPICSRCVIMGDHRGHDVQTLEDKNKESLSEMEPAIVAVQETMWRLEKSEQVISQAMPAAQVDTSSLVEEVQLHFQHLHSLLQAREDQLVEAVREAAVNTTKPFEEAKSFLQNEKCTLEMNLMDALQAQQGNIHTLVDADLILEQLKKAPDIACVATVEKEAVADPIRFSFDASLEDTIGSYGNISTRSPTQMVTLTLPGPDAPKPPPEELPTVTLPDLEAASTDTESVADSASVIVEEDREESGSVVNGVATEPPDEVPIPNRPGQHLVAGRSEKVQMTYIRTPAQFYVQLVSRRGELETMQRHINAHCSRPAQQGKRDTPHCLQPGTLVLAQYSKDKKWYRAVITKMMERGQGEDKGTASYEVFFMDYGNLETITCRKMYAVKKTFESQPAFAYECALDNLLPADKERGWTTESVKLMLDMTSCGVTVMKVIESGLGALHVDLIKPETLRNCVDTQPASLREALLFQDLAVSTTANPPPLLPGGSVTQDYLSLARTQDGDLIDASITHVDTPSLIYVQRCEPSSVQYLNKLTKDMQDAYSGDRAQHYAIFCPRPGMMCVARYHKDQRWHRARVTALPGGGRVQVMFVDYGNTEIVGLKDLCNIKLDFIKFPRQAIQCALVDVQPAQDGQWSKEALDWVKKLTESSQITAQIRVVGHSEEANSVSGVLYIVSQHSQLCCVNYELVQQGFATSTGPRSQRACYEGVTLQPPPAARSSPRRQGTPPGGGVTSPRKGEKRSPLLARSPACRTITLRNLRSHSPQTAPENTLGEEGAAQLKSVGVEVVISHYRSPAHFCFQLQERQSQLLSLMTELAAYETEAAVDRVWKAGEFCVAKYSKDNSWYRAKITQALPDNTYEVSLMDYGHMDTVPAGDLRLLKKVHGEKECFAERCHLVNLAPAGSMDPQQWTATAVDFMADEIRAKRLFLKLEGNKTEEGGLPVDILIEELIPETALAPVRHQYVSLVERLQAQGLAVPITRPSNQDSGFSEPPPADGGGSEPFHTKLTESPVDGGFTETGTTDTGEEGGGKEEQGAAAASGSVVEEEMAVIEQPDCDVMPHPPPTSTVLTVIPVHINSQGIIFAHDCQDEDESTALMNSIDQYARTQAPAGHLEVKLGQVCLAHYAADDAWFRARVLELGHKVVKVKYIDYGNTDRVDRSLLKLIPPELCEKHQVAYEFRLHNLKPNTPDGSWPQAFLDYMDKQLLNQQCTALVKGDRGRVPVGVDLVREGDSVSNTLLQTGNVSKEDDMEDIYERTADITNILRHSNPYFPLRPGDAGSVFNAIVTHMDLPNLVYLQRSPREVNGGLSQDLLRFVQMMADLPEALSQCPLLEEAPSAGEMCCAQFSKDETWYRALVAKTFPHDQTALVFYVDYGNSEVVTLDRLRPLPAQFQDLPAQALRAYLNVDLPAGATRWTLDAYRAMSAAIFEQSHLVLIKFTEPLTVELFREEEHQNGAAILSYQQLVTEGTITIPKPLTVTDMADGDNVIVESEQENGSNTSELD